MNYGKLLDQANRTQIRIFDVYYHAVVSGDDSRAAKARRALRTAEQRCFRRRCLKSLMLDLESIRAMPNMQPRWQTL